MKCLLQHARHQRRFTNCNRHFADRFSNCFNIYGLKIFFMQTGARCLAGNAQNRNGISRSGIERGDHVRARRTGSPQTYADIPCRCAGITFRHVRNTFHMTRQNVTNTAVLTHR
ncbi:Uncharacterised protein [Shigella flexneri]|nr:Uncharacterised protein [Shigella flexneri]